MLGTGLSAYSGDAPLIAFASVLASSLGVPVPTFIALVFVGSLLGHLHATAAFCVIVFICAMIGAGVGDMTWFLLGRRFGGKVLSLLCRISLSRDNCIRRTADFFATQGLRILLVARFLPGLSTVTVPLAGASGVPMGRFYGFAAFGAALWITTGLALGYFLAPQIAAVLAFLRRIGLDVAAVAVLLTAFYVLYRVLRRRQLIRQLRMARIDIVQLLEMIDGGLRPAIIDVRSAWQREQDPHIIPGGVLWEEISKGHSPPSLAKTTPVVIYCVCPNEASAAIIARQLHKLGYHDVRPLRGGLAAWRQAGQPTQPLAPPAKAAPRRNNLIPQLS